MSSKIPAMEATVTHDAKTCTAAGRQHTTSDTFLDELAQNGHAREADQSSTKNLRRL